jgi:hypothetical protein
MDHPLNIMLLRVLVAGVVIWLGSLLFQMDFALIVWPITTMVLCIQEIKYALN